MFRVLLFAVASVGCTYDRSNGHDAAATDSGAEEGGEGGPAADGGGEGEDAGSPPTPRDVRLCTWNVHDLFDTVDEADVSDIVVDPEELDDKLARLGAVLREIDADVIALQEVEHRDLLERLVEEELADLGYDEIELIEAFDPRGIDVGLIARLPVTRVESHAGERFPSPDGTGSFGWSRDALEVHMSAAGRDLVVVVNHLISQTDPENEERRVAQARRARAIAVEVEEQDAAALVALVGDMNDVPESETLTILLGDGDLVDSEAGLPPSKTWTFIERGRRERLDYVLFRPALSAMMTGAQTHHGDSVDDASDHQPVVADLHITPP